MSPTSVVTHGMDTAAGLQVSIELERGSQDIAALASRVEQALHGFDWMGVDADDVRGSWASTHRPQLDVVTARVAELALRIRQEAQAQDAASGEGAAAGGPTVGTAVAADPTTFRGDQARQPDGTTCGSSSLVMSRMVNDPAYAAWIMTGRDPVTGATDPRTPGERFAAESLAMHERTNGLFDRDGDLQLPWPEGFGTSPWATANEMSSVGGSGVPGTDYGVDRVSGEDRGASFDKIVAASQAGHTVPVYVGDGDLPRHVVLATGTDGASITFYEPGDGRTVTVTREQWLNDQSSLGGWNRPWFVVTPRD